MKKIYFASLIYLFLGLGFGVFYREFTKINNFPESGQTQLSVVHTHLLSLGFLVLVVILILEKQFILSKQGFFAPAFWLYNIGLVASSTMMVWHGIYQVLSREFGPALSGIAGLGHIVMSLGLLGFMATLGTSLYAKTADSR
jgi:hypothetical protein